MEPAGPILTRAAHETEALGAALAPALAAGDVVVLSGPLGAGKTRLVAGLARGLGVAARVRSPSFTLVNEYRGGRLPLFHLDLYRLEAGDTGTLGLEEMTEAGALVVEWGERLPGSLRREALAIAIEPGSGDERRLTAVAAGGRGAALLAAWSAVARAAAGG